MSYSYVYRKFHCIVDFSNIFEKHKFVIFIKCILYNEALIDNYDSLNIKLISTYIIEYTIQILL